MYFEELHLSVYTVRQCVRVISYEESEAGYRNNILRHFCLDVHTPAMPTYATITKLSYLTLL